ncbi:MAG: DUF2284 domain-containing protein [Clostridia bacterium]|nr:DUF2284 domain-containing protein [Clostridia bacterium]
MELRVVDLKYEIPCVDFIKEYVDVPRFLKCCSECPGYGKTWACPPYDFDPAGIWASYGTLLLYAKKVVIPEEARRIPEGSEREAYESLLRPYKEALFEELLSMEREEPGSFALSAGGCLECEACTRPENKPCRLPSRMRYSVESIGGDVLKAIENLLGEKVLWAEKGMLPEHFILLGGLLKKQ